MLSWQEVVVLVSFVVFSMVVVLAVVRRARW